MSKNTKMDEATLLARANEEREKIFQRYERGREPGNEIDPWEDPKFEIYMQTDRYGFIHDTRLPEKKDPNEQKQRAIEMERVKKWLKMLKNWNSKDTQEKLHKRVCKGIPDKLRSQVWMKLLNLEEVKNKHKNKYQEMLKVARQWSTEARQIDSDVNRQFREHMCYRERYNIKQQSLFNVLVAYSMYNMEVGYCQGMSGLAGILLMYMDEEEAFWALSILLSDSKYAMHGLFIEGFPKLTRFLAHHDRIIAKFLPKVKKHFDQFNLDAMLYSLKWFFVVFVERIPFSLCLRVWDIYLKDGEKVVTAMAYTILRLHKTKLLKLKDMDLIVEYLQVKLHKNFGYDDDAVIKMLEQCMEELRKAKMDLPPPPEADELPKGKFGEFKEPTTNALIGRRKDTFSEIEKTVTDTVILKRELTAQQIAEAELNPAGGSNSQLNTAHIPESEDGASLLGSSRKSLADTSVTSTADLSILSGGQRSQAFGYDDQPDYELGGNEGESSPGSALCSLSIVARSPSVVMATPTPRAMSPDVVRIYVPPAPPEETGSKVSQTPTSSESTNTVKDFKHNSPVTTSPIKDTTPPESFKFITTEADVTPASRNGRSSSMSRHSGVIVTAGGDEESLCYSSDYGFMNGDGKAPSSSSRRGSMSRKSPSPMFEKDFIIECSHLKSKTATGSKYTSPTSPTALAPGTPEDFHHSIDREYEEIIDPNKVFRVISTSHTSSVENLSLTSPPPRFSSFSGSLGSQNNSNNNQSNPNLSNLSLNKGFKGQQIYQSHHSLSNGSLHHEPSPVPSNPASPKIYTSFEELAKSNKLRKERLHEQTPPKMPATQSMNRMPAAVISPDAYKNQQNAKNTKCTSDEEKYSLYYSRPYTHPKKGQSDYSIQYNAMLSSHAPGTDSDIEYKAMRKLRKTSAGGGGGGSGNESSPYDYEMLSSSDGRDSGGRVKAKTNSFKQYSRFFNTDYDATNDDDEDEEEEGEEDEDDPSDTEGDEENGRVRLIQNKSSDESSSSPKSPQTTPMNEAIPLLSPDLKPSSSGRPSQQQVAQSFQSRMKAPRPVDKTATQKTFHMELTRRPNSQQPYSNNVQKQYNPHVASESPTRIKSPTNYAQNQSHYHSPASTQAPVKPSKIPTFHSSPTSSVVRSPSSSSSTGGRNHSSSSLNYQAVRGSDSASRRQRSGDYRQQFSAPPQQHHRDDEYTSGEYESRSISRVSSRKSSTDSSNRITIKINQKK